MFVDPVRSLEQEFNFLSFKIDTVEIHKTYNTTVYLADQFVSRGEGPDADTAYEAAMVNAKRSALLASFWDEWKQKVPSRLYSQALLVEKRLAPSFDPYLTISKSLGIS